MEGSPGTEKKLAENFSWAMPVLEIDSIWSTPLKTAQRVLENCTARVLSTMALVPAGPQQFSRNACSKRGPDDVHCVLQGVLWAL